MRPLSDHRLRRLHREDILREEDIWEWLERLAPGGRDYKHHRTGEDNGDAHLKSLLEHHEVTVPITKGALDLGPWQQIFYAEFDGQLTRSPTAIDAPCEWPRITTFRPSLCCPM